MPATADFGLTSLSYSVIKIDGLDSNGVIKSSGTGFFYSLRNLKKDNSTIPSIITNRHVTQGHQYLRFHFGLRGSDGKRLLGSTHILVVDCSKTAIIAHPTDSVDLVAIPVLHFLQEAQGNGTELYYLNFGQHVLPPNWLIDKLEPSISLLMVGFPNGLIDEVNNLPITRRGILATPFKANYKGRREFVADIAAFPGSSGSPVIAYFENKTPTKDGNWLLGTPSAYFLGVLYAGPTISSTGEIVQAPIPTSKYVSQAQIMMHLAFCIKYTCIFDIEKTLTEMLAAQN